MSLRTHAAMLSAALENDTQGKIVIGYSKMGKTAASSGSGSLFDILFRCVGIGKAELRFEQAQIYDASIKAQPSKWLSTHVKIIGINVVSADVVPRSIEKHIIETILHAA
jgi:hypothetical protein